MRKNTLLLMLTILQSFSPVASKADDVLYDIDFSSPTHTVGSQMTTGEGPAPRNIPTESIFGEQIVASSFGSLTQQPVELIPRTTPSGQFLYSQFRLNLEFTERYPIYQLNFDVCMENFTEESYDEFVVLFDIPVIVRIDFDADGNIRAKKTAGYSYDVIGSFDFGQTLSMSATVYLESNTWSIYANSNHLWTGQFFFPYPAHPEPPEVINNIRFNLSDDSDFPGIPACAMDNIQVIGLPEPSTVLLLGLGALLLKRRCLKFPDKKRRK